MLEQIWSLSTTIVCDISYQCCFIPFSKQFLNHDRAEFTIKKQWKKFYCNFTNIFFHHRIHSMPTTTWIFIYWNSWRVRRCSRSTHNYHLQETKTPTMVTKWFCFSSTTRTEIISMARNYSTKQRIAEFSPQLTIQIFDRGRKLDNQSTNNFYLYNTLTFLHLKPRQ